MLPELKEAEKDSNKQFKKQNKLARDGSWKSLKTVEQKARADPKEFLTEAFPKGATGRPANLDIVVVKIGKDEQLHCPKGQRKCLWKQFRWMRHGLVIESRIRTDGWSLEELEMPSGIR
jgi:hypothetical protein